MACKYYLLFFLLPSCLSPACELLSPRPPSNTLVCCCTISIPPHVKMASPSSCPHQSFGVTSLVKDDGVDGRRILCYPQWTVASADKFLSNPSPILVVPSYIGIYFSWVVKFHDWESNPGSHDPFLLGANALRICDKSTVINADLVLFQRVA